MSKAHDQRPDHHEEHGGLVPENDLVRWLRLAGDRIRPHLTTIVAVVAAVLVLWGYFTWRRASAESRRAAAWNEFFAEDYDAVVTKYQDTDVARYARMRLAENAFQNGKTNLLAKRSDAIRSFEKAEQNLDYVAADIEGPLDLRRTAALLKGVVLETSGAPEKAKEQYNKVKAQFRDSNEAQHAEARIKELSRTSATDFYRQLANYKPGNRPTPPRPVGASGNPDLDELLKGIGGGQNPNLPLPPAVKTDAKDSERSGGKPVGTKGGASPQPPTKMPEPAPAPGTDLPENQKPPGKEAAKDQPKTAPKPGEPTKKSESPKK